MNHVAPILILLIQGAPTPRNLNVTRLPCKIQYVVKTGIELAPVLQYADDIEVFR